MKKTLILIIIFFNLAPLFAEGEVLAIENLITTSEKQLEKQRELKILIVTLEEQKDLFLKGDQSKALAGRILRTSSQILSLITENHLQYLFPHEYMEELTLFTSMASKKSPVRP